MAKRPEKEKIITQVLISVFATMAILIFCPALYAADRNPDEKSQVINYGKMEIFGRIEAPQLSLDLEWDSPNFISRSIDNPVRSFKQEIFGNYAGKAFFKYNNQLNIKLKILAGKKKALSSQKQTVDKQ